ncbi:hypothetical protein SCHPADRAFT_142981 [Schizopora paradoxa]|uniref:Uncharacterized protein n=1 Tax=Schizopora paradoxa TaxID=27342 RepID=A0A0H2SL42_9AGAM|nr:hypothetical protein SCHPADRAFT_142981 [Schizopora paradoxa]
MRWYRERSISFRVMGAAQVHVVLVVHDEEEKDTDRHCCASTRGPNFFDGPRPLSFFPGDDDDDATKTTFMDAPKLVSDDEHAGPRIATHPPASTSMSPSFSSSRFSCTILY